MSYKDLLDEKQQLKDLEAKILADGIIEDSECDIIDKVLLEDGKVDRAEADFLFHLKDHAKNMCPRFCTTFADRISDHLLGDDSSPGMIDEEEEKWFLEMVGEDGKIDDIEKMTIEQLREKCPGGIPQSFLDIIS